MIMTIIRSKYLRALLMSVLAFVTIIGMLLAVQVSQTARELLCEHANICLDPVDRDSFPLMGGG